jgi:hypothetical protein
MGGGQDKSLLAYLTPTRCQWVSPFLLEGHCFPLSLPLRVPRGNPRNNVLIRAAVSSMLHSFLKALFGTLRFGVLGGGTTLEGVAVTCHHQFSI